VSEFQYYEFVAIDSPLSLAAQKRLRAITSRATITATRLVNTYEWGDFKGGRMHWLPGISTRFSTMRIGVPGTSCCGFR
jgi:hypothetical protein